MSRTLITQISRADSGSSWGPGNFQGPHSSSLHFGMASAAPEEGTVATLIVHSWAAFLRLLPHQL